MSRFTTFTPASLHGFTARVFKHFGIPPEDATIAADVLAYADLRGIDSHGVARLRTYVDMLTLGLSVALAMLPGFTTRQPIDDTAPHTTNSLAPNEPKPGAWYPLFNGENLNGWIPKFTHHQLGDNYLNTFRVEDGLLRVAYDNWTDNFNAVFGHLTFAQPFSHYRLRVEYRFIGEQVKGGPGWAWRNNGIMLHGQQPETMTIDQEFPVSIEVQLLGGDGTHKRPTANLCTPGTNVVMNGKLFTPHCTNSKSPTFHGDEWTTIEIEVRGGEIIRHKVDGITVLEYASPQLDRNDKDAQRLIKNDQVMLTEGYISIQAESHPTDFRKIELQLIEDEEATDEPRP